MNFLVRCYKGNDLDLYALSVKMGRKFSPFVRACLSSFIKNEPLKITPPPIDFVMDYDKLPSCTKNGIHLDEVLDADIIEMLNNIHSRKKNSFVKAVVRQYIGKASCLAYCNNQFLFYEHMGVQYNAFTLQNAMPQIPLVYPQQPFYPHPYFPRQGYPAPVSMPQQVVQQALITQEEPPKKAVEKVPNPSVPVESNPTSRPIADTEKPVTEPQKHITPSEPLNHTPEPEAAEPAAQRQISDGEMKMFDVFSNML